MKLFFTNALILTSFFSFCQDDNYNFLKNYKAPDYSLSKLDLSFKSRGTSNKTYSSYYNEGELGYTFLANKSNRQNHVTLDSEYGYRVFKNNSFFPSKQISTRFDILCRLENRFYLNPIFFIGLHGTARLETKSMTYIDSTTTKSSNLVTFYRPAISIGLGRVEPVRYAQSALNIQNALISSESMHKKLSNEEMNLIGNEVAKIKNRRFFDGRLQRIYEIEKIDSLLKRMGINQDPNVRYFSLMSDALLYSTVISRYSGLRHELGLGLNDGVTNSLIYPLDQTMSINYSFSYFKPISNTLQGDFRFTAIAISGENMNFGVYMDGAYEFGFYPNTRTHISIKASGGLNALDFGANFAAFGLNGYYYLSPKFRLSAKVLAKFSTNYDYYSINYAGIEKFYIDGSDRFMSFNLGLNYAIF